MSQYEVNNTSISTLLTWIRSGEVAIPEIQRPFVWDSTKVRDLIDSLYSGFPVGYIIVWKNPDIHLKGGTISAGKKILIDGQQRITALQAAIVGETIVGNNYHKKRIKIAFHPLKQCFEVANPAIEKDGAWIADIAPLYQPGFDSFNFVINYCKRNHLDDSQRSAVNAVITHLQQIQNNNIGVIELSHQLDIAQVTDIFIRINSKGVVLSQADFAMSKISSDNQYGGNQIRKIIDYFCHLMQKPEDYDAILHNDRDFSSTEDFATIKWVIEENEDVYVPDYADVLRVSFTFKFLRGKIADLVSLLSGRDFNSRDYQETIAVDSFAKLKEGVLAFVRQTNFQRYLMIVKSTGIISSSLIRSQNVLNFGYALYLLLRERGINSVIIEKVVRRWIVLTILTGRYSGSPESTFDYDIKRFYTSDPMNLLQHTEEGELSDAFWNNILITKLNTAVASSPMFHVFLMAQVKLGDFGFLSEQIDVKTLIEQRGDIHHIFPKKYLQKCGIKERGLYNQIANYVYTQSEINIKIKDLSPRDYMARVKEQCIQKDPVYGGITSLKKLEENMAANCVPEDLLTMDYTHFEDFLAKRRCLMAQKIRKYYQLLK
ncbi:MAG: DUF262 domain-containing protein [Elusimicrobiaceae bacterium]|nr:DUF262 domain-containing protein [Elusimicrobiaceae bacterium]